MNNKDSNCGSDADSRFNMCFRSNRPTLIATLPSAAQRIMPRATLCTVPTNTSHCLLTATMMTMKLLLSLLLAALVAVTASARRSGSAIRVSSSVAADSKLGLKLLSKARRLEEGQDGEGEGEGEGEG